ncbi:MAG TPA: methyltransferase, partial [Candidatus Tumulicola sp.]
MRSSRTGATSPPQAASSHSESATALARIAGAAVACGAARAGGTLHPREVEVLRHAAPVSAGEAKAVRDAIIDGADPLGEAFLAARSPERRRRDGAFYTGDSIVRPMLEWMLQFEPARLIDTGCGSGRFAAAALRANPRFHVVAVDADPIATLMTRAVAATLGARNVRVVCGDFLRVEIERCAGRTGFVGNPPYVRHHDLTAATKEYAKRLALDAGLRASGLSGLHAWFFVATCVRHAVRGDVGAYVTSAQWLDARYGAMVRQLLSGPMGGRSLLGFDVTSSPFDAMTTATIATFEIGRSVDTMLFGKRPHADDAFELERTGNAIAADALRACARWSEFFEHAETHEESAETIGSAFRVSRGQVTGNNGFFVMSRGRAIDLGIDAFCIPVIASAREVLTSGGTVGNTPERQV